MKNGYTDIIFVKSRYSIFLRIEDGCLFRVVSYDTNIILEMKTISLAEYLFIYNPEDGDITKKMQFCEKI